MQIIEINLEFNRKLVKLKTHALANIFDFTKGIPDDHVPCGDDPDFVVMNMNTRIVYSIELQLNNDVPTLLHHISITSGNMQKPSIPICNAIMTAIDMGHLEDGNSRLIWYEGPAFNAVQRYKGPTNEND